MKSGQILILVLLIVVVALAVGLSVASRNIVNLRTSTQTKESQRAFGAAEGGVEDVLSRLSTLKTDAAVTSASGKDLTVSVGDLQANVNVKGSNVYESKVELGEVAQIDLVGPPLASAGSDIQIDWAKGSNENPGGIPASVEISEIYGTNSRTSWYYPNPTLRGEALGANTGVHNACTASNGYSQCVKIVVAPGPVMLRIKPFWASTTVKVSGVLFDLPVQTYDISSSASGNAGVTRKVQVTRTALPMMPAVFDYAIFSEGSILK